MCAQTKQSLPQTMLTPFQNDRVQQTCTKCSVVPVPFTHDFDRHESPKSLVSSVNSTGWQWRLCHLSWSWAHCSRAYDHVGGAMVLLQITHVSTGTNLQNCKKNNIYQETRAKAHHNSRSTVAIVLENKSSPKSFGKCVATTASYNALSHCVC